jgi:hypothetical protein
MLSRRKQPARDILQCRGAPVRWNNNWASCPKHPRYKYKLQREPAPQHQRRNRCGPSGHRVGNHINVGRENGDQQSYQSPGCRVARSRNQQSDSTRDLAYAADLDHGQMPGNVGRHDFEIELGLREMLDAGANVENGCENQRDPLWPREIKHCA